jgi:sec-independent protein translocase protein TatB
MFGIGMPEMLLILAIALIVIGPKKLPDLAKSLGRAMGEFKRATNDLKDSLQVDTELKEVKDAFEDMNKDLKENVDLIGSLDDDRKESADAEPAQEKQQGEDDYEYEDQARTESESKEPLRDVKKAFDRLNQETKTEQDEEKESKSLDDNDPPTTDDPRSAGAQPKVPDGKNDPKI